MRRDLAFSRLCALSMLAGLRPLAWQEMTARAWASAVREGMAAKFS